MRDDDLACDDCHQPTAMLALAAVGGFLLTAGWIGRAAYGIAVDTHARSIAGWPW